MCGRVTLTVEPEEIAKWLRLAPGTLFPLRYNIAPTQMVAVVREIEGRPERDCVAMRWGLVPEWSADIAVGSKMINARSETVFQKPSFRQAIISRRCVIPVSGFFEWKASALPRGKRQPFLIQKNDQRPFALAGLWERNSMVLETPLDTFTILTTRANALMKDLHERMPVILPDNAIDRWLNSSTPDVREILMPYAPDDLQIVPVNEFVNNAVNEGPQCVAPPSEAPPEPPAKRGKSRDARGQQFLFD